jgi:hypothetical protein
MRLFFDNSIPCHPDREPSDPERSRRGSKAEWRDPDTLSCAMPHQGVLPMQSAAKGFCFSDHARLRRCRRSRRSIPSLSRCHPESRARIVDPCSFLLLAVATFSAIAGSGAGEGSAPLLPRVSRPRVCILHNDESSAWQKEKCPNTQRRRRVAKLAHPKASAREAGRVGD